MVVSSEAMSFKNLNPQNFSWAQGPDSVTPKIINPFILRKILFETHHLYYWPNFRPIIEQMILDEDFDIKNIIRNTKILRQEVDIIKEKMEIENDPDFNILIEGDIKSINEYLFLNLYILKFFRTVRHDEDDTRKSVDMLKKYVKEQQIKREMTYNN